MEIVYAIFQFCTQVKFATLDGRIACETEVTVNISCLIFMRGYAEFRRDRKEGLFVD